MDPLKPAVFPILPCNPSETCPNWLGPKLETVIQVATTPALEPRVIDDRGRVVAKATFNASGNYTLTFEPDQDFFYRDSLHGEEFRGREYFLQLWSPPGAEPREYGGNLYIETVEAP